MSVRAVIFDFGGVIVRTEDQTPRRRAAERLGVSLEELYHAVFDSPTAALATIGLASAEAVWASVAERFRLDPQALAQLRADFWAGDRCDDALVTFIRNLRPGVKTGILSNAWPDGRAIIAERFGLRDAVDDIVISAEVGIAKPDARIFALAVDRLGVAPHEALFVDDFLRNIEGARAAGLQALHFRDARQAVADVRAMLDAIQEA